MHGLLKAGLVNWISAMTYQAASGAGANNMKELITQMGHIHRSVESSIEQDSPILDIDEAVLSAMNSKEFPVSNFGLPLAGNLIPWIDSDLGNGQSREEWKAQAEGNKILGTKDAVIPIDGLCVRIGAMRCHSQALTFNLKEELPTSEIEEILDSANEWVKVIPNTRDNSIDRLSPVAVTRTLDIPIGRIRKMSIGRACYSAFTVGDQLLWGAAEPLRRMLKILVAQG
jgi:aspartate-semialdehyde dehydrogenase